MSEDLMPGETEIETRLPEQTRDPAQGGPLPPLPDHVYPDGAVPLDPA